MAVQVFQDDDPGFLRWRDAHPKGFIVNANRRPVPSNVMLHRADCPHLRRADGGVRWTRDYIKICAGEVGELARWARQTVPGGPQLQPCQSCKP